MLFMRKYLKLFEQFKDDIKIHQAISDEMDSIEELTNYLLEFNIPVDKYGTDGFKTISHLLAEIKEGETVLKEENGELHRYVEFIGARVIYKKDGINYRLYETKQVFKDGRTRVRNLPYSMAEKFKPGEDTKNGLIRGFKEELDIVVSEDQFAFYNKVRFDENSDYPGIKSHHIGHEYLVLLNDDQYSPEGYIERQSDKDVHFGWRKINGKIQEKFNWKNSLR